MTSTRTIKKADLKDIRVECLLLCDYAKAENGKLHIVGGGWSEITPVSIPSPFAFAVAIKVVLPIALQSVMADFTIKLIQEGQADPLSVLPLQSGVPEVKEESGARSAVFMGVLIMQLELSAPGNFDIQLFLRDHMLMKVGFTVAAPHEVERDER